MRYATSGTPITTCLSVTMLRMAGLMRCRQPLIAC